ncbi:MAG: BatA domain-containing protein, partial [Tepidisphaeraceae bacterium]
MTQVVLILGVGFVTPAFALAGVALVSVPIIIHLLNRRRFRTVHWAAMDFLLRALRKNRRRIRFEQWLLLAVRCCVLLLLGLALARPLGCADSTIASLAARRTGLHVIVIDNSYSMAYEADRPDAKSHLDQAKLLARRLIDRLSAGGEAVAIVSAARPASAIISAPAYSLDAARSAIDRIEQSDSGTDLPGAFELAREIGQRETRFSDRFLYVLSDSTRSAWEVPQSQSLAGTGRELAKLYTITHFSMARADQWNSAVLDVHPSSGLVRMHFANDFVATVRGFGDTRDGLVQWKLDDQLLPGGQTIRPQPDTSPITQSRAQMSAGGPHVLSVSLASEDRLRIDDTRWHVLDVAAELKVLIVEGERGAGAMNSSGSFLQLALAPPSEAEGNNAQPRSRSYVMPELISDLEFGNKVLSDYRCIILAGVAQISANQADQVARFVRDGGTLMIFMGEPVSGDAYNSTLLGRGLLPGQLTKRITAAGDQKPFLFDFKPDGSLHPLLGVFRNQVNVGLDSAQVFTYWQVEIAPDGKAQRVLDFLPDAKGHRDVAISVHDLGAGHVVFVSTTANAEWTTLPGKPAYVALVHELLSGSVSAGDVWMNLTVGQPLVLPPTLKLTSAPVLKDPQQSEIAIEQTRSIDGQTVYRTRPLSHPGLYTLTTGVARLPIAVNVPGDEADV